MNLTTIAAGAVFGTAVGYAIAKNLEMKQLNRDLSNPSISNNYPGPTAINNYAAVHSNEAQYQMKVAAGVAALLGLGLFLARHKL
jgi:hypothetical protein